MPGARPRDQAARRALRTGVSVVRVAWSRALCPVPELTNTGDIRNGSVVI